MYFILYIIKMCFVMFVKNIFKKFPKPWPYTLSSLK